MNVRKNWINTSSTDYHSVEDTIADVKNNYDIRRYYSAEGYSVKIDNITTQVIIQSHLNPLNQGNIDRKIHMPIESVVGTGSIIEWDSDYWIIVSSIDDLSAYKSASMIKSNNTLSFYSPSTLTIHSIPCYIDSNVRLYSMGAEDSKYISIPDSSIIVRVANTTITKEIRRNDIFLLSDINYKIVDINNVIEPGLIVLKMEWCSEEQLAHTFVANILNGSTISIQQGTTLQLNVQVTDNDTVLPTPTITYTSSDIKKCTVSTSGLVAAITTGTCTITATSNGVSDSIALTVVSTPVDNFTYEIVGESEIVKGYSESFTANKYNNGVLVSGSTFTFSIINGLTPISAYTLTVIDGDNCTVKANSSGYTITLRATDVSDITKYVDKELRLVSLF